MSTLIVIPYRDREEHLSQFKKETIPLLAEGLKDFLVLVVEQEDERPFNRGALINIGVAEFEDSFEYVITNDVDFYPSLTTIKNLYSQQVKDYSILGIYTSVYNTLGGVIKLKISAYKSLNGFPNDFWGWGVEDKALQNRAAILNFSVRKNLISSGEKHTNISNENFSLRHDHHTRETDKNFEERSEFEYNKFPRLSAAEKFERLQESGLNNLSYEITSSHDEKHFKHIKAKIL